jgi:hypothetical protein
MIIPRAHPTRRSVLATVIAALIHPGRGVSQSDPNQQERTALRIELTFANHTMTATLHDNPSARDFASMLPLDLTIEDFGSNEKIAHLPRKLTVEGHAPFGNEQPYDLCYYLPWGNLAMFYAAYEHPGLIRLGRFDDGYEALQVPGKYPLRIQHIQ